MRWALARDRRFAKLTLTSVSVSLLTGVPVNFGVPGTMICSGLVAAALGAPEWRADPSHVMPADLAQLRGHPVRRRATHDRADQAEVARRSASSERLLIPSFGVGALQMVVDGAHRHDELACDLGTRHPLRREMRDLYARASSARRTRPAAGATASTHPRRAPGVGWRVPSNVTHCPSSPPPGAARRPHTPPRPPATARRRPRTPPTRHRARRHPDSGPPARARRMPGPRARPPPRPPPPVDRQRPRHHRGGRRRGARTARSPAPGHDSGRRPRAARRPRR